MTDLLVQTLGALRWFDQVATHTPLWLAVSVTAVGATLGALLAVKSGMDLVGIYMFAIVMGFGGGMIRDTILGNLPPQALLIPDHLIACLVCATLVLLLRNWLPEKITLVLVFLDAWFLGLLATVGVQASFDKGLGIYAAVFVGTIAAVGGGIIADLLLQKTPSLLIPGPPYALAGFAAALTYAFFTHIVPLRLAGVLAILVAFAIRLGTYWFGFQTSAPTTRNQDSAAADGPGQDPVPDQS